MDNIILVHTTDVCTDGTSQDVETKVGNDEKEHVLTHICALDETTVTDGIFIYVLWNNIKHYVHAAFSTDAVRVLSNDAPIYVPRNAVIGATFFAATVNDKLTLTLNGYQVG